MMTIRDFDTGLIPLSQQKKTPLLPRSKFAYNRKKLNSFSQGVYPGNIQKTWPFVSMTLGNFKEV